MVLEKYVAPFAGAWIEIKAVVNFRRSYMVAPFAGAWIEMISNTKRGIIWKGRSLCGSVD